MACKIRLGYTVINKTMNLSSGKELRRRRDGRPPSNNQRNKQVAINLETLEKIVGWNIVQDIGVFRLSEYLIPKPLSMGYESILNHKRARLLNIGASANETDQVLTFHSTDLYFGSPSNQVWQKTVDQLKYFSLTLEAFNCNNVAIVAHLGPNYLNTDTGETVGMIIQRIRLLPAFIKEKLSLENDGYWSPHLTSLIARKSDAMFTYDWHHHRCYYNKFAQNVADVPFDKMGMKQMLISCLLSWRKNDMPAKVHISSSCDVSNCMKHADLITWKDYSILRNVLEDLNGDVNLLIEAKQVDEAVLDIHQQVKMMNPIWKQTNKAGLLI